MPESVTALVAAETEHALCNNGPPFRAKDLFSCDVDTFQLTADISNYKRKWNNAGDNSVCMLKKLTFSFRYV